MFLFSVALDYHYRNNGQRTKENSEQTQSKENN